MLPSPNPPDPAKQRGEGAVGHTHTAPVPEAHVALSREGKGPCGTLTQLPFPRHMLPSPNPPDPTKQRGEEADWHTQTAPFDEAHDALSAGRDDPS